MSDRPELHTPDHDQWDQGGYCNNLVTDDDGCGTICGYRQPREPFTPGFERVRDRYTENVRGYRDVSIEESFAEFDRFIAKVKADVLREAAEVIETSTERYPISSENPNFPAIYLRAEADRLEAG